MEGKERPIKVREAAALLGMTEGTVYQYVSRGILPHLKKGKRLWFLRSELEAWDRERTVRHPAVAS